MNSGRSMYRPEKTISSFYVIKLNIGDFPIKCCGVYNLSCVIYLAYNGVKMLPCPARPILVGLLVYEFVRNIQHATHINKIAILPTEKSASADLRHFTAMPEIPPHIVCRYEGFSAQLLVLPPYVSLGSVSFAWAIFWCSNWKLVAVTGIRQLPIYLVTIWSPPLAFRVKTPVLVFRFNHSAARAITFMCF